MKTSINKHNAGPTIVSLDKDRLCCIVQQKAGQFSRSKIPPSNFSHVLLIIDVFCDGSLGDTAVVFMFYECKPLECLPIQTPPPLSLQVTHLKQRPAASYVPRCHWRGTELFFCCWFDVHFKRRTLQCQCWFAMEILLFFIILSFGSKTDCQVSDKFVFL